MPSSDNFASDAPTNPAVQRCLDAARKAFEQEQANGADNSDSNSAARDAFRNVMPPLAGAQNIQDFIACVACGLLRNVMYYEESMKLLYAAQVAASAIRRQPSPQQQPNSQAPSEPKPAAQESLPASMGTKAA